MAKTVRKQKGSTLIELAAVAWVLPVAAVMAVNIGLLVFGAYVNDSACRDAVRAAAQQNNKEDSRIAAYRALKAFRTATVLVSSPQILLTGTNFEYEAFPDSEGRPQLEKGPYVKVTTFSNAKLPVPIVFGSTGFTNQIIFKQSYIFPILNPNQIATSKPQFDPSDVSELAEQQAEAEALAALAAGNTP